MSIVHRVKPKPWYIKLAGGIILFLPESNQLLQIGVATLISAIFLYFGFFQLLGLGFNSIFNVFVTWFAIVFGMLATVVVCHRIYGSLYPLSAHEMLSSIRPRTLIIEQGRIAGVETYNEVCCISCGKTLKEVRVEEDDFRHILRRPVSTIAEYERHDMVDHVKPLAETLRSYGVELLEEETPLFHKFYTLEYDRVRRAVVAYRPPKEYEMLVDITHSAVQVVDFGVRGDENDIIILIAFKIQFMGSKFVVSTCLLGIMKSGHVWLNQTLHTLPPRLDDHLAWSMGLNPGDEVVEADRAGAVWRPRLTWQRLSESQTMPYMRRRRRASRRAGNRGETRPEAGWHQP